jgi:hypothetical protein
MLTLVCVASPLGGEMLRKTEASLNFKIETWSMNISQEKIFTVLPAINAIPWRSTTI